MGKKKIWIYEQTKRLIEQGISKCEQCESSENITLDHIIPLHILRDMGFSQEQMYNDGENLRILCRKCNALKAHHLDFTNPKTKILLIKYLTKTI